MSLITNFGFSVAELLQRGDKLLYCYKRDAEEFKGLGYGPEMSDVVEKLTADLKDYPSDDYYEGEQKVCTNTKNADREELENNINDLANRSRLALGPKSVDFGLFKFGGIGSLTDADMVRKAKHVVNVAGTLMDKLAKRLVTNELLDAITAGGKKLDNSIDRQSEAQITRKEKALERNELANELYSKISELCTAGKGIWKGKNEAHYTDYVIYGSSKPMADQAEEDMDE